MLKNRSKLLLGIVLFEIIFSVWILFYFNYLDHLNYNESIVNQTNDLALLIQNMYTSTWWALIILVICLITVFTLTSLIYQEVKFLFIALCLWIILLILAINTKDSFFNNISIIAIFIPIYTINILAYHNQKKLKIT